jgi:hypothetical protein
MLHNSPSHSAEFNNPEDISKKISTYVNAMWFLTLSGIPKWSVVSVKTDMEYIQEDLLKINISNWWILSIKTPDWKIMTADLSKKPIQFKEKENFSWSKLDARLAQIWVLWENWKVYRDKRLASPTLAIESSYISWEAAIYFINEWKLSRAKEILDSAVISAIKNNWRIPRLFYADGNPEGEASTNWDASTISIALWKYIEATKSTPNDKFRKDAIMANEKIQGWLKWLKNVGWLVVMSDKDTTLDWIQTKWTHSISVENNARMLMSKFYTNEKDQARQTLQKLIDASFNKETKQFSSWVDINTLKHWDEYARDGLSLLVLAADKFWILNKNNNKQRFLTAAKMMPWFTLPDGTFWYSFDHSDPNEPGKTSVIPEFMYLDYAALKVQWLDNQAKKTYSLAKKADLELKWAYSTEYASWDPNAINPIMEMNAAFSKKLNYYS